LPGKPVRWSLTAPGSPQAERLAIPELPQVCLGRFVFRRLCRAGIMRRGDEQEREDALRVWNSGKYEHARHACKRHAD